MRTISVDFFLKTIYSSEGTHSTIHPENETTHVPFVVTVPQWRFTDRKSHGYLWSSTTHTVSGCQHFQVLCL